MSRKGWNLARWWAGLAAVVTLLGLCFILLDAQITAAQGSSHEQAVSVLTEPSRLDALAMETAIGRPAGPQQVNEGFTVDLIYDAVWGLVDPGAAVTVERVGDGAYGAAEADAKGFFWTPLWLPTGQPANIDNGDTIEIYVHGALEASIPVLDLYGGIDLLADEVAGAIPGGGAGIAVTVTIGLEGVQPPANAPQATATTGPAGGGFTALFPGVDLGPSNLAVVEYASGGGRVRAYLYPNDRAFEVWNQRGVRGYADPGQQVNVTVYEGAGPSERWSGSGMATWPHGLYTIGLPGPGNAEAAQVGDLVEVDLGGGEVLAMTVAGLGITGVDATLDQVDGTAPAGETVVVRLWQEGGYAQTTATADGGGAFTANLSGIVDLRPRDILRVALADAEGDESLLWSGAPHLDVLLDPFSANDCVLWRVDGPNLPITLTLQTATGVYTRENPIGPSDAGNTGGGGCYLVWGPDWGPIDFSPGNTVTVRSPTWEGSLVIPEVTWSVDTATDQVSGQAPPGEVVVTVREWQAGRYPIGGSDTQSATAASAYTVTFPEFDVRDGGTLDVHHYEPGTDYGAWYYGWENIQYQYFEVSSINVYGVAPQADEHITAYLYDTDGTTLLASTDDDYDGDPWGFGFGDFQGYTMEPGYWLTLTADSGWTAGLQLPELTVQADENTDLVWGEGPKAWVLVHHGWDHGEGWQAAEYLLPVDGYLLDVAYYGAEIERGDAILVRYQHPKGDRVIVEMAWPLMQVYYGTRSGAGGVYAPGHGFSITVTSATGDIKATGTVTSTIGGANGGATGGFDGFRPSWLNGGDCCDWLPGEPDIQPGDWVYFQSDDGYENQVQAGTIYGTVDVEGDSVAGPIYAAWLTQTLEVWCYPEYVDGPPEWRRSDAEPDGSVPYFCEWHDPTGGQLGWDIQPDDEVLVSYLEPDGDHVYRMILASDGAPQPHIYLPLVLKGYSP